MYVYYLYYENSEADFLLLFGSKNKTPISILQELCTKWGVIPQYKFVARDGPVHDPVFEYCVVAGEHSASGKGKLCS